MNTNDDDLDRRLDGVLDEIRSERLDPAREQRATGRVWERIAAGLAVSHEAAGSTGRIRDCADFQALLSDYRDERLPDARRLLLEDHLGSCVTCRRALRQTRVAPRRGEAAGDAGGAGGGLGVWGWRAAAAAVVLIGVFGVRVGSFETGGVIRIQELAGEAFVVTPTGPVPVEAGETVSLAPGESLRTAKGSTAMISLADDSQVEVGERAALAVSERRYLWPGRDVDGVIDLERGNIIVEASDQGSGHLFVETAAAKVAVTGTVFAVSHGVKGSRVSVVEGEVRVEGGGETKSLVPGEQATTSASLERVPIEDEIAWSRNARRHIALLRELRSVGRMMDSAVASERRYGTALLDRMPADTIAYVAIPNIGEGLSQAWDILRQRVASNPVLAEWWQERHAGNDAEAEIEWLFGELREWGDQLGDEVVVALQIADDSPRMVLATTLSRPEAFPDFFAAELAELGERTESGAMPIELHQGSIPPERLDGGGSRLYLLQRGDLLLGSPDPARVQAIADGSTATLRGTAFHERVAAQYEDGVEWLFAFDLARIVGRGLAEPPDESLDERETLERTGLLDVRHLIAEHRQLGDRRENRAVLTFDQARRGVASWLAEPAPMGSLDFITPDAHLAAAFLMKEPAVLIEDLFGIITSDEFEQGLADFEREYGVNVREDLAAPLGGEFAVAIDGPVLPVPSWKVVIEVYDPQRLQQTVDWLVERVNTMAAESDWRGLALERELSGGREYTHVSSLDTGLGVHWVIVDGYLVAGPSRALLDRAIQARDVGLTLPRSPAFARMLPQDGQAHFSAVMYQRLNDLMSGPLARMAQGFIAEAAASSPEQQALMQQLSAETPPSVSVLYGEPERIVFVNTSLGGLFESGLSSLIGYKGLLDVQQSLFQAVDQAAGAAGASPQATPGPG